MSFAVQIQCLDRLLGDYRRTYHTLALRTMFTFTVEAIDVEDVLIES